MEEEEGIRGVKREILEVGAGGEVENGYMVKEELGRVKLRCKVEGGLEF